MANASRSPARSGCPAWHRKPPAAFALVRTRCSNCMWPASSSTQYQLLRSPRSNPMVSFCCTEKFLLCLVAMVLTFFIAGLLYLLCLEHVDNLGAYTASRPETGLLIPSVSNSYPDLMKLQTSSVRPVSPVRIGQSRRAINPYVSGSEDLGELLECFRPAW